MEATAGGRRLVYRGPGSRSRGATDEEGRRVTLVDVSLPAVSAATMAEIDRLAIEDYGITLPQMMDQAGSHLAEVVRRELGGDLRGRSIVVAAGPGHNGGGGLAAARHLMNRGAGVRVILSHPALQLAEAARAQLATLIAMGAACCVLTWDLSDEELEQALARADAVVDALLGYGARGAPRGGIGRLVGFINRSGRPVISLDVPTGLDPDSGVAHALAIRTRATVTLALPKAGLSTPEGRAYAGRLYLADLGLPAHLYRQVGLTSEPIFTDERILELPQP
jgi:NAD(P)H-hydrate epimerase